jgi:hypothetical protein
MKYSACHSVALQTLDSFPDADKRAFVLSLLSVTDDVPVKTLQTVSEILTGTMCHSLDRTIIFKNNCVPLCFDSAEAVRFYSVSFMLLHSSPHFSQWCQQQNTWPTITTFSQKEEIKSSFEECVKDLCTFCSICASCSIKYTHDEFSIIDVSDVDLTPLQIPADCGSRRSSSNSDPMLHDDDLFDNYSIGKIETRVGLGVVHGRSKSRANDMAGKTML